MTPPQDSEAAIDAARGKRMELETINKLYLELSQITTATTAREILLQKQLAEAQRNAATPTPDAFRKALRLAQRESLDRTGSGVVNWNQADAVMSDEARHLVECYIAAIDAAKGEPS